MVIPIDCVDLEDFKRMERGLPPRPKPEVKIEPPERPVVPGEIKFDVIPDQPIRDIAVRRDNVRNKAGTIFIGVRVFIEFENGKRLEGWMSEETFIRLRRAIPGDRVDLLQKAKY